MKTLYMCTWDDRFATGNSVEEAFDNLSSDWDIETDDCEFFEVHPLNVAISRSVNFEYKD